MTQQHFAATLESDDGFREMIYTCGPLITVVMMWLGMMAYFKLQDWRLHKSWEAEDKRRKEDKDKTEAAWQTYGEESMRRLEPLFKSLSEKDTAGSDCSEASCPAWTPMTEKTPELGQTVITYHQLNRVEMMTYTEEGFQFPITCPVNSKGEPLGWTSGYVGKVITHWMPLPSPPNAERTDRRAETSINPESHV